MSYDMNTKAAQQFAAQQFAYEQSQTASGYSACEPCQPPSLTSDIASKLGTLSNILGDSNSILTQLGDRLFGSRPCAGSATGNTNKPMGQAAEITTILDSLIDQARYAREEAAQLNSRI